MNDETLLHRNVHPKWLQQGRVTRQAFKPTPKDQKRLSVYDGDQIDAEDAYHHFTSELGFESVGVLAVSVAECRQHELPVQPDPFPEHTIISFEALGTSQIEKKAKRLSGHAVARDWLFEGDV